MGVNAGVDLDAGFASIAAHLDAGFGSLNRSMHTLRRDVDAMRAKVPVDVRFWAQGAIPTPTARSVLSLGGPQAGFYWLVRRIVVGGLTFKTAAAGTGEVYVSGLAFAEGQLSAQANMVPSLQLIDLVDQFTSLPAHVLYSNEQIIVQENENLLVLIDSGTQGQTYTAGCQVRQFRRTATAVESTG